MSAKRPKFFFTAEQIKAESRRAHSNAFLNYLRNPDPTYVPPDGYLESLFEVFEKHARFMARHKIDPDKNPLPALSPLAKWFANHDLEAFRESHNLGYSCIPEALSVCLEHDLKIPEWLASAYLSAVEDVKLKLLRSWDDAFGPPIPKGTHASRLTSRRYLRYAVYNFVSAERERGAVLDEALFERAGKAVGIKKTLASELFYEAKKMIE